MKVQGLMRVGEVLNLKWLSIVGLCACMASISAFAQDDPHRLVEETTTQVLALLKTGIDPIKEPDEFVLQLSAVLDPVMAFNYIAKGVLGVHAEKASPEQQKQFSLSFKKGLVSTYGKGLSGFQDVDISVLAPAKPVGEARRTTVVQEVRSASGVTKVSYSMAKNRQDQWKVINLVLNGINFGQTFRGQFAAAVEKNNGDLDKTIHQWESGVQ
ncbi:MAG: phospholipid transport system substrate-binding protein [Candidatus Endobugula sp.]|jgi:phospholipid transport system substrate-binding protein